MPPDYTIFLLSSVDHATRRRLAGSGPTFTDDPSKANVFVGVLSKAARAKFELRRLGIVPIDRRRPRRPVPKRIKMEPEAPAANVIVISSSSSDDSDDDTAPPRSTQPTITVARLAWLMDSMGLPELLPLDDYTVYTGHKEPTRPKTPPVLAESILRRAYMDRAGCSIDEAMQLAQPRPQAALEWTDSEGGSEGSGGKDGHPTGHPTGHTLTPPGYVQAKYACQRVTPLHPPNEDFVARLKAVRTARRLAGDEIGVRAYATAIAAVAAYPRRLQSAREVEALPGCGPKIGALFRRAATDEVDEIDDDRLAALRVFQGIMGVAAATAHAFYARGWRDLDDVIEFGWRDLTRTQQLGVKYYDELHEPVQRPEVERIAERVRTVTSALCPGVELLITGGYRRGQAATGDVDLLLSHRDARATHRLVERLVHALEHAGLVTHTLQLSTAHSQRGQETVSHKGAKNVDESGARGFDTLDKALVVWQEPAESTESAGRENTNPHRRVDLVVTPWRTVGCAVLGWTGATTFERDLRRYCRTERGLKFDSSGARRTSDGAWVDLEDHARDPAPDMETAERRVFAALGLAYRAPSERCTG